MTVFLLALMSALVREMAKSRDHANEVANRRRVWDCPAVSDLD